MGATIFLIVGLGIVIAMALFSGIVKGSGKMFSLDPSTKSFQGDSVRQKASETARDNAERTRRLMEQTRAQMERNRR